MQIKNNITTNRLLIRDYKKEDVQTVTSMWFDKENGKYMSDPEEGYVNDRYTESLDEMEDSSDGYYLVVELKETHKLIGTCCMFPEENNTYDIGYCIHKDYWKCGYGSEVIEAILAWLRERDVHKVTAEVAKENSASCALLRKYGFKAEKETRFKKWNMDVWYDSYVFYLELSK